MKQILTIILLMLCLVLPERIESQTYKSFVQIPTEEYQNECGEYLDRYINSVKEAGNIWAVPVIDLNASCGLYPIMDEYSQYFHNSETDRLHPNDAGHIRIAKTLVYQLLSLPCSFQNAKLY